ncbi:hypothetical protein Aperf_G00000076262 [Anoplocephala perfoliata]
MRVEFIVPQNLDGCELKPYVAWRASVVDEPPLTAKALFDIRYADQVRQLYKDGKNDEDIQTVAGEKADVEKVETKVEVSNQTELDLCEWRPQSFNPEQASLSWTCDINSKESDHFALGWTSQINSETINCSGDGESKEPKKMTTYSPLVESEFQGSVPPSVDDSRLKLFVEHVPPKAKSRKNFVRQNAKQAKLECLLQEQRMDLVHAVDDFLREYSQETTQRSEPIRGVAKAKPLSYPKMPQRQLKLINFKKLDKYVARESKSCQLKDFDDGLRKSWHPEFISVSHETTPLKLPISSETSAQANEIIPSIQESRKLFSNYNKFKNTLIKDEPEKTKSKREIMMEYSKSVAAANSILSKKTRPKTKPKSTTTLDKELAKILQAHEAETQRIASLFLA